MRFIDKILSKDNMKEAYEKVIKNKGAAGIDGITVEDVQVYIEKNWNKIKIDILNKRYQPTPVKRIYIPKSNGKKRPLGIPTVMDRIIQQAIAQQLELIYEPEFSNESYGFRPGRSCEMAITKTLEILNDGYEWVIDLDIEKFFDTVNHDKLISILRKHVNDSTTLHLIRAYLKAGYMEEKEYRKSTMGTPQGSNLSPILSNIMLDEFDKELESRGLRFVRYADDCNVFLGSEKAANRVIKSVSNWLERKLFLKVNITKTKVVRPTRSEFLGFTYFKNGPKWRAKPSNESKTKLIRKIKAILLRRRAVAMPLAITFRKINWLLKGWINYFRIASMKGFIKKISEYMRHKVRVVIVKQWKKAPTIMKNLIKLGCDKKKAYEVANSSLGLYKQCGMSSVNFALNIKILSTPNKKENRPGLVNPVEYYNSRYLKLN